MDEYCTRIKDHNGDVFIAHTITDHGEKVIEIRREDSETGAMVPIDGVKEFVFALLEMVELARFSETVFLEDSQVK